MRADATRIRYLCTEGHDIMTPMSMAAKAKRKWDRASRIYDLMTYFEVKGKNALIRRNMLRGVRGRALEVGMGTGHNLAFYLPGARVVGIDVSPGMLFRARRKARKAGLSVFLVVMDAANLAFKDGVFDTVTSTCVFCSVPDPGGGLREIARVLRPGGQLLMYEHVLSQKPVLRRLMEALNPLFAMMGPQINRDTVSRVREAGLLLRRQENVKFFDVFKRIDAARR